MASKLSNVLASLTKGQSSHYSKIVLSLPYAFIDAVAESSDNIVPARSMAFHFFENLFGVYKFLNSFPQDTTDFDESRVDAITKDQLTVIVALSLRRAPTLSTQHKILCAG